MAKWVATVPRAKIAAARRAMTVAHPEAEAVIVAAKFFRENRRAVRSTRAVFLFVVSQSLRNETYIITRCLM